ncbi:hypothetical protein OZ410_03460 [Robiginitalea sp. M366]|uniref:hypothetical protein n=1 Tax=Robiginitalea aestuariiviva TaxID=3036903 RepID=UPI00240D54B5|nr:hypothetical protein [Robiginitalea aestuariiviva]MDG1571357.1 hypothetical protein [Robiginitalea aestuariiviva]
MIGSIHCISLRGPLPQPLLALFLLLALAACDRGEAPDGPVTPPFGGTLEWARLYGGSGAESARAVIPTEDGGFAVLGYSESTDGDLQGKTQAVSDYWLLKFDAASNLEWSRTYGGSKEDLGQALIQTADGGYALTGYAMSDDGDASSNQGFHDNWVLRLDAEGNVLWEQSFGFSGHDHSYDILATADGGLLFTGFLDLTAARADGYTEKGGASAYHGVGEFWCTKLEADGTLAWRFYFGGSNNDRAHAVTAAPDGGFVLAGFSESGDYDITDPRGSYDFWVVKLDPQGRMVWERNLGGSGIDTAADLVTHPEGGYLVTGHSFSTDGDISNPLGEADLWLARLSEGGDLLWEQSFGGPAFDAAEAIAPGPEGSFFLAGNTRSTPGSLANAGENDLYLVRMDAGGNNLWQATFGGAGIDLGFDAAYLADGSLVVVGELAAEGAAGLNPLGMTDLLILKYH